MKKPISRKQHGVAEFGYIPLAAAAPELFGFSGHQRATVLSRSVAAGVLTSALTTRAEWGLFKLIPFKIHLAADLTVGLFIASAPFLFGFARNKRARNAFLALGLTSIVVPLLTQNEEMTHE
ncbi:hypothetical protein [Arcticibacter sp. MXS-1]|uniref:hypothetical protein n=1 Tax=Arcticibacter sp. MXS-1 TaxID=3341726 RepID=UPI0035A92A0C